MWQWLRGLIDAVWLGAAKPIQHSWDLFRYVRSEVLCIRRCCRSRKDKVTRRQARAARGQEAQAAQGAQAGTSRRGRSCLKAISSTVRKIVLGVELRQMAWTRWRSSRR